MRIKMISFIISFIISFLITCSLFSLFSHNKTKHEQVIFQKTLIWDKTSYQAVYFIDLKYCPGRVKLKYNAELNYIDINKLIIIDNNYKKTLNKIFKPEKQLKYIPNNIRTMRFSQKEAFFLNLFIDTVDFALNDTLYRKISIKRDTIIINTYTHENN